MLDLSFALDGHIAVVTGASRRRGIGFAACRALAALGADIFFTYWPAYDAQMAYGADRRAPYELEDELSASGIRVHGLEIDLTEPDAPRRLYDAVEGSLGPATILINNATYSTESDWQTLDAEVLDRHYEVNLRATALISTEFARRFRGSEGGRIINLTSGQSLGPMPGELAYAATKGAIEALTVSLAPALAARGITVNAVNPGPTDTGWMTEEQKEWLLRRFPMGRIGEPEDAARLIAFLASPAAAWITGQVIHSEGGFVRG